MKKINLSASRWETARKKTALNVFRNAVRDVPAYRQFLKISKVSATSIKTWRDFIDKIPLISKPTYLRKHSLETLMHHGDIGRGFFTYSSSSGSTGKPQFYPRTTVLAQRYSEILEQYLTLRPSDKTLVVITFGLGVWIGGIHTFEAFYELGKRRNLSVITTGLNKEEIHKTLREIGSSYSQIILVGYPPFVKDLIDELHENKYPIKKGVFRFIFAAEVITEQFRDVLCKNAKCTNPLIDVMNIYGTADLGAMAFETPYALLVKRLALKKRSLFVLLFGDTHKIPTFAQYDSRTYVFEEVHGEVVVTAESGIPLVRYTLGDSGGVCSFTYIEQAFKKNGLDLRKEALKQGIPVTENPFVYVFERSDFSTKLYGATIYPEHIREALQDPSFASEVSGKFMMRTLTNARNDQYLELNVELKAGKKKNKQLEKNVLNAVVKNLRAKNAEYENNYQSMYNRVTPLLVFWRHEDPLYFKPTIKQKWVVKTDNIKKV